MFTAADPILVNRYLEEIARTYNVDWKADVDELNTLLSVSSNLLIGIELYNFF